jgi:hypothetical protein
VSTKILTISITLVTVDGTSLVAVTAVLGVGTSITVTVQEVTWAGVTVSVSRDDGGSITVEGGVSVTGY